LADDARRRLGHSIAVGAGGSRIFLYAGTEVAAREAARVARDVLAEHHFQAGFAIHRWHPLEERWEDPGVAMPRTEDERQAEHQRLLEDETAESLATGAAQWEVRADFPSHQEAVAVAPLRSERLPVIRRWKFLVVGANKTKLGARFQIGVRPMRVRATVPVHLPFMASDRAIRRGSRGRKVSSELVTLLNTAAAPIDFGRLGAGGRQTSWDHRWRHRHQIPASGAINCQPRRHHRAARPDWRPVDRVAYKADQVRSGAQSASAANPARARTHHLLLVRRDRSATAGQARSRQRVVTGPGIDTGHVARRDEQEVAWKILEVPNRQGARI
jgi:hypothetical protein